ncbi:DUF342 domain-containing protein [uncultured Selenomonas sp.]|uniref:DUF342 domain-containing protein n=1 Tax=uncultured Selenomonas sp. TaxID=159275 RepID=UPI0025842EB4|nr:FapA family protein [uncultured Selenomonas sp.]
MEEEKHYPAVGSEKAGYLFEFRPDGVYFTVYPTTGSSILYELSDMRQILADYGVDDYDILTLAKTVRKADGVPVKLSSRVVSSDGIASEAEVNNQAILPTHDAAEEYAGIDVDVSRDKITATIRFDLKKGTRCPTADMVRQALKEKGVVFGIDEAAIAKGAQSFDSFVAARGVAPVNGADAHIEKKYDISHKGRPRVIESDRVDYKDMNLFVLAKAGQLLAERIPQTHGQEGKDVFGFPVPARNGKPIPLTVGKNAEIREENKIYALIDGQIVEDGKRIGIDPHLSISGSVGVGTGNIDFVGSVQVSGNIDAGFVVKATGDVEVSGFVSGADVEGRNVFISGGITGQGRGKITAKEDVRAAFAENALVEAGRDIYIADAVLHSTIKAGKKVVVEDRRGLITGGYIAAGEEIRAKVVGNQAFVVTKLVVGVNPALSQRYQQACREYKEDKQRLSQITQMLNTFSKIDTSRLPENRVAQIAALTRSQFPLAGKIKREEKLIEELQEELGKMEDGKIRVADIIYPGVSVSVNSIKRSFQTEARGCTLTVQDDEVTIGPY